MAIINNKCYKSFKIYNENKTWASLDNLWQADENIFFCTLFCATELSSPPLDVFLKLLLDEWFLIYNL